MAVAKPKEGAGLYAKGVLGKIFKERTGEEIGKVKRELLSEVVMGLIPGAPAVAKPLKILKPHAIGKVIIKGGKILGPAARAEGKGLWPWIRSVLQAPQKELSRVRGITPERKIGETGRTWGTYHWTPQKKMELSLQAPVKRRAESVWHELAHARQDVPFPESPKAGELLQHWDFLREATKKAGVAPTDFYWSFDPLERHARAVEKAVTGELGKKGRISPQRYDEIYERLLDKALEEARTTTRMFK